MGVSNQRHTPVALPPGKTRYPLYKRLGSWTVAVNLASNVIRSPDCASFSESLYGLTTFDPRTVQVLASRYTD